MDKDEIMEEIEEQQKERKLKKEIQLLKEKLGRTGKEPKNKKIRLEDVCREMYEENYMDWYIKKKENERKKKEEEKIEEERQKRIEKAREKKRNS